MNDSFIDVIQAGLSTAKPTEKQAVANNYRKGRCEVHGLKIAIENPRNSIREGCDASGKPWQNLMKANYGHFEKFIGNDGDGVDCFIGEWPESSLVYVINQKSGSGTFDEHKVMLGFMSKDSAVHAYNKSYSHGWDGMQSIIRVSVEQLRWWLQYGNKKLPITQEILPFDSGVNDMPDTLDAVFDGLVKDDAGDYLMDSCTVQDVIDSESEGFEAFDAIAIPYQKLDRKMSQMMGILKIVSGDTVYPVSYQVTEPYKTKGTTNVAAVFELSDGQTVSVFFHNPDVTPNKIMPLDEIISWKWLLNKKDVTVLVAPENGKDLNVREVSRRIMKIAEKNSARFAKANADKATRLETINTLKANVALKESQLAELDAEIAAIEVKNTNPVAAAVSDLSYKQVDELFTAFYPNTEAGKEAWKVIADKNEGVGKVPNQQVADTVSQLISNGYTVSELKGELPVNDDVLLNALGNPAQDENKKVKWFDESYAEKYTTVYQIGSSRTQMDSVTLSPTAVDGLYKVEVYQAGVSRSISNYPGKIVEWLQDVMAGLGDAITGNEVSIEKLKSRLRIVKGEDILFGGINPIESVILDLPVTEFRPEEMRVLDNGSGLFLVQTKSSEGEWITQKEHADKDAAIADAEGWYKKPFEALGDQIIDAYISGGDEAAKNKNVDITAGLTLAEAAAIRNYAGSKIGKMKIIDKRNRVMSGEKVIFSDREYDMWINDGMPTNVASIINPNQVGILDSLLVFTKESDSELTREDIEGKFKLQDAVYVQSQNGGYEKGYYRGLVEGRDDMAKVQFDDFTKGVDIDKLLTQAEFDDLSRIDAEIIKAKEDAKYIQSAINGELDFYDKSVTDKLAELSRQYQSGEVADLLKQAKSTIKQFFANELAKKTA